jgi:hypothetical protein
MVDKVIVDRKLLEEVKELIDMIMGEADKKKIDSLALYIGHNPDILNPHNAEKYMNN